MRLASAVKRALHEAENWRERKRAEEELKIHRDHLEELVREHTAELTMAKDAAEADSYTHMFGYRGFVENDMMNYILMIEMRGRS